jgi:hypothetical protein
MNPIMNKGKNLILSSDKISITGNEIMYSDNDENVVKDTVPDVPSKNNSELNKARIASSPKTCAEIINIG